MKINKAYPIKELMDTIKEYIKLTNRRVTFEYIMLEDINDSEKEAKELMEKNVAGIFTNDFVKMNELRTRCEADAPTE